MILFSDIKYSIKGKENLLIIFVIKKLLFMIGYVFLIFLILNNWLFVIEVFKLLSK